MKYQDLVIENPDDYLGIPGVFTTKAGVDHKPFQYGILISFPCGVIGYGFQILYNLSSGNPIAIRAGATAWKQISSV